MVALRAESAAAVSSFTRLYPKEAREAIVDIVAAYGIRCMLNEVALEQLSLGQLGEIARKPVGELGARSMLRRGAARQGAARRAAPRRAAPKVRHDVMKQWPFVDGDAGGVGGAERLVGQGAVALTTRREGRRGARAVFAALRRAPDRLAVDTVGTALEEVVGRRFPPLEVGAVVAASGRSKRAGKSVSEVEFLRMVRAVSRGDYVVPERGWDDEFQRRAADAPPPEPAVDEPAWARAVDAPCASARASPAPASSAARQRPPAASVTKAQDAPWFSARARGRAAEKSVAGGGGAAYSGGALGDRRVPKYLAKATSKVKPALDAHRRRLRTDKAAAAPWPRRPTRSATALRARGQRAAAAPAPSAVDIADAFLGGDAVGDWDALRRDLARPAPPEPRPADDFGVPLGDDELYDDDDDYGDGDVRPDVLRNRDDDRERATAWLGDYGPLHARTLRPSGGVADDSPTTAARSVDEPLAAPRTDDALGPDDPEDLFSPGRDDDDDELAPGRRRPDDDELEGE
ncbi:hypothetical protein JL721_1868 [Aureococcus anophagefferens]|nr:hypothetical protein JL721_1868 [Aureococcus anophagefferens]